MLLLASLLLTGARADATVDLPLSADVRGREVTLGAVARVACDDDALRGQLEAFDLGYAPAPGYSRLLYGYRIEEEIERAFPGLDVQVSGERSVRVRPVVERIEAEALERAALRAVEAAAVGGDFAIRSRGDVAELLVPAGAEPARLVVKPLDAPLASGSVSVPVEVWVDGSPYRTRWAAFEVVEWQTVAVLAVDLPPGTVLEAAHFRMERITRQPGEAAAPLPVAALVGSATARGLRAGRAVTELDVHRPLAIVSGSQVYVEVRRGSVVARSLGAAIDSGSIGDRIRVTVQPSGREMRGVVAGRELVVIDLATTPNTTGR